MKTQPTHIRSRRPRRGSAILAVLLVTLLLGALTVATLTNSMHDTRLNERHILVTQAQNAAESLVEYGAIQLDARWETQSTFPKDELQPGRRPLEWDTVESDISGYGVNAASLELVGGLIPEEDTQMYIDDPSSPLFGKVVSARQVPIYAKATATHPTLGDYTAYVQRTYQIFNVPIFSHAIFYNMDLEFHPGPSMTITGPVHTNGNLWVVAKNELTFDQPVTAAGEFRVGMMRSPGNWSSMSSESDQRADIVFFKDADGNKLSPYKSGTKNLEASYYTSKSPASQFTGTGTENWRDFSSNRWDKRLKSKEHGVPSYNPVGYKDYVPDVTPGPDLTLNPTYALIEPAYKINDPYNKGKNAADPESGDGEEQKLARYSGIVIKVWEENVAARTSAVTRDPVTGAITNVAYNYFDANRKNLDGTTAQIPAEAVRLRRRPAPDDGWTSQSYLWYQNEKTRSEGGAVGVVQDPAKFDTRYLLSFHYHQRKSDTEPNSDVEVVEGTYSYVGPTGAVVTEERTEPIVRDVAIDPALDITFKQGRSPTVTGLPATEVADTLGRLRLRGEFDEMFAAHPYAKEDESPSERKIMVDLNGDGFIGRDDPGDGLGAADVDQLGDADYSRVDNPATGSVDERDLNGDNDAADLVNGMVDRRIRAFRPAQAKLDLIEINMAAFARMIEDTTADAERNPFSNYNFPDRYNGVVYVEFPRDTTHTPRPEDRLTRAVQNRALFLTQAGGTDKNKGRVPDPAFNKGKAYRDRGFLLATNGPIYTKGHFNADGKMSTGSSVYPDKYSTGGEAEPPAALAGDAITVLSNNFTLSGSGTKNNAADTEFCAGVVCGLAPTNKNGAAVSSGGSHNFPRFLENWSGKTFRYRGSLVALFESEIQNDAWSTGYYDPPARDWGYYNEFRLGNYPPFPPMRATASTGFRFLTEAEYNAGKAGELLESEKPIPHP